MLHEDLRRSSRLSKVYASPLRGSQETRLSCAWFFLSFSQSLLAMIALLSVETPAHVVQRVQPIFTRSAAACVGP